MGGKIINILVTGATGYIGKEFVKAYTNQYNIIVLSRETSDTTELELFKCAVIKFKNFFEIDGIFSKYSIDGVLHFASSVVVDHEIDQIDSIIDSNIRYGIYLLEACKKYNTKWFINIGTFWQNYKNENYNPVNFYAATKEAFQNIGMYYTETSDLVFTTIKLNDTFGPNDTRFKIFNLWDEYSKSGKTLEMSNGEQIIDISYIEDVLNAFKVMIENLQEDNNVMYNNKCYVVSSKHKITLKKFAELFMDATSRKLVINWGAKPYRKREVMSPYNKGQTVPNWKAQYTLTKAIQKTIGKN